jgi:hypothetical protein
MTDRADGNGRYVRWSTVFVIGGILAAILVPSTLAGIAWGARDAKLDALTESVKAAAERSTRTDEAIGNLNISVARLSGAVEALTRRLPDSRGGQ